MFCYHSHLFRSLYLYLLLTCFASTYALGQTKPIITNYNVRQYSPENQLASNQNWAVAQDKRGILYFGNNDIANGILEFDGSKWGSYKTSLSNTVYSLAIDSLNRIFIGSAGEFGFLKINEFGGYQFYSLSEQIKDPSLEFGNVWCIHVLDSLVIFQSNEAIFIWDETQISTISSPTFFHKSFVVNGEFWVREHEKGIYRFVNNEFQPIKGLEFFSELKVDFILNYDDKQLLLGTRNDGLFLYNQENFTVKAAYCSSNEELKEHSIYGGLRLKNKNFALATLNNGLYLLNEDLSLNQHVGREDGLQSERIWNMLEDDRGNLWLALNKGIDRIELNKTIKIAVEGVGYSGEINDLILHPKGIYMATSQGVFLANTQQHENWIKDKDGIKVQNDFIKIAGINEICWSLTLINNDLLIGSNNSLFKYTPDFGKEPEIITSGKVLVIKELPNWKNTIITAGNSIKLIGKINGKWKETLEIDEINGEVRTMVVDPSSTSEKSIVWLGDNGNALIRLELYHPNGEFKSYSIKRYSERDGVNTDYFHLAWVDRHLAIGTNDGLKRFNTKGDSIINDHSFGKIFNGSENQIWKIFNFPNHENWIVMNDKAYRVTHSEDKKQTLIDSLTLRTLDLGLMNVFIKDPKNTMWIGCYEGLASVDLNKYVALKSNYYCTVRKVILRGKRQLFKGNFYTTDQNEERILTLYQSDQNTLELDHEENSLVFEFAAIRFESNVKLEYSYMLQGYENEPSLWSKVNSATYTNLNPGEYTFTVMARDIYGITSDKAVYRFSINPPWYETTWFYMIQVGSLMGLVFLSYVYNRSGQNSKLSHILTLVTIITLFEFMILLFEGYVDDFSGGVPVFKLLMNVVLAVSLNPIEKFIGKLLLLNSEA